MNNGTLILEQFTELGKWIANMARSNYWSCEDTGRAIPYQQMLPILRRAYVDLRSGVDSVRVLTRLRATIKTGIERNMLERMIESESRLNGRDMR